MKHRTGESDVDVPRMVMICPDCDEPRIRRCGTGISGTSDAEWRCEGCGWTGDDPVERPEKQNGSASGGSKLAAKLERMSADEVGAADD